MRLLKRFLRGLTALAHKTRDERELNEELDAYLEMAIECAADSAPRGVVAIEKLAPGAEWPRWVVGMALAAWGAMLLA